MNFTIKKDNDEEIFENIMEGMPFEYQGVKYFPESTSDWVSEGKYQVMEIVYFREVDDDPKLEFYLANYRRSGSYHSDYNYDEEITFRVARAKKVTKIELEIVK